ncbi:CopG family ribbon-helix-helix protein [Pseudomonas viridiflava]|uniref:CopG family ribbon-helix-helix protein n=1 Tax=Pseudomonas viridiflava TaxID=33069 RepID=UPI000F06D303|nr:CopG family ribbon-helix-helix protein [Pseudomonas viridiflava]
MATSIKIDDELKSRIQHLAGLRQRSPHWVMREAIAQYVDREEAREGFKQEALASCAVYQETGRHMTGQEARAWLNTWGTEAEAELPKCHD